MKTKILLVVTILVIFVGCKSSKNPENTSKLGLMDATVAYETSPSPTAQVYKDESLAVKSESSEIAPKIIKTASISMQVVNYAKARQQIDSIVILHKAYIVSEGFQQTDALHSNSMEIKISVQTFDKLLASLAKVAKRVDYQNINTQDVTEEYIDVKTRLENKIKVEKTYISLLQKTKNIEDILKIENKLGEIRAEIESAQGRLKYIDHQVSLSTVSLYFYQQLEYKYTPEDQPNFWQRLKESIHCGWKGIVWFVIFLIKLWPLWIVTAIGYYTWKKLKDSRKPTKSEKKKKKEKKKNSREENTHGINADTL